MKIHKSQLFWWYIHIYIYIYLSIYRSDLSIYLSIHPSIHPSIHLSIYPSIHPSIYLSIYLSCNLYHSGNTVLYLIWFDLLGCCCHWTIAGVVWTLCTPKSIHLGMCTISRHFHSKLWTITRGYNMEWHVKKFYEKFGFNFTSIYIYNMQCSTIPTFHESSFPTPSKIHQKTI